MPAKDWTELELDLLIKALVTAHLPVEAKRAVASEVRKQCLGAVPNPGKVAREILQKLGYENLTSQE
jgi:hypothetical protein